MTVVTNIGQLEKPTVVHHWLRDVLLIVGASLLISLFARVAIPLPFTPVPLVLQLNVCLSLAILLGSKRGTAAVLLFLAQGACGLPVFATGTAGLARLFCPTGGYLLGYVAGTYLAGYLWERAKAKTRSHALMSMAAGNLVVYALGVTQLSQFIGLSQALLLGVAPFLISDALKLMLCVRALDSTTLMPCSSSPRGYRRF